MKHLIATKWGAVVTALLLALVAPTAPAYAALQWLLRNTTGTGDADVSFTLGNDRFAPDLPLETIPRLTIEVT